MSNHREGALPAGWIEAPLSECADRITKGTTPTSLGLEYRESGIPFVRVENLSNGQIASDAITAYIDARAHETLARSQLQAGDLLFSIAGTIGRVALVRDHDVPANTNQALAIIRVTNELMDGKYLLYALSSYSIQKQTRQASRGGAMSNVSLADVAAIEVRIPPLAEQRRIVAEIEKQFTRLDHGVSALEAVSERVRVYTQATLNSFTHPAPQKCMGWTKRALSELADIGTGSTPLRSNEEFWRGGTIPWVTSTAVNRPYIDEPQDLVTKVALERTTLKRYPPGTLLIAMYGEGKTRGKVSELRIDATINQALAAIQIRLGWSEYREYTKLALTCAYDQIRRQASGGVQPNLNLGMISALEVWLPPPSEVAKITSDLSEQLTDAANMLSGVALALARAARLRQAILHKAFEGKLVPQDPNDEPASVLLERIYAARAQTPARRAPRNREVHA